MPQSPKAISDGIGITLFEMLAHIDEEISPDRCKVHLASSNSYEDPLELYLNGTFDEWQRGQKQKNFRLDLIVSLIQLPEPGRWLFVGVHDVKGLEQDVNGDEWFKGENGQVEYHYLTSKRDSTERLSGRLVVAFKRTAQQYILLGEKCADSMLVAEIYPERIQIAEFSGYMNTTITKQKLDTIVRMQIPSWKSALSSVSGVYVIADRHTGKLYVGSATGERGIWGRWSGYSSTGHGGNKDLRKLLKEKGIEYAANSQYGILETGDSRASESDILERESYWKELLLSREHGNNSN